ncbi:unnamed protein product [Rhizoctonia solani]|uniref:Uncharacterized protein n=1 Tax=Rhizoctonia solani TaxID=456999 RepID=A0A8H2WY41_9AGAM|nr:unnamed protein product [Rhizoctonia solani]
MHFKPSYHPLEALSKASFRSPNLFARSRSFGSTSWVRSLAASHSTSSAQANPFVTPKSLKRESLVSNRQGYTGPSHALRTKPAHPRSSKDGGHTREVHISVKVKNLCLAGKFDEAVEVCMNAPAALQGAPAWNTVIHYALSKGRYNYAHTLYQQMKKRHIVPTISTYTTFMSAYAHAEPETFTVLQLERVQKLYKDWVNLVASARTDNVITAITSVPPAAAYISVLANAKLYQSIWDIFYSLETEGPLAPNQFIFTNMFIAFAKRTTASTNTPNAATPNDTNPTSTTPTNANTDETHDSDPTSSTNEIKMKNGQDARLVWRLVLRALERQPFPVDSHLVVAALRALQYGGKPELDLALEIVDKYLGLRAPDAPAPSEMAKPVELNFRLLDAALRICNAAKRPELTRHFLDVLTAPEHPQRSIVNTGAMNLLIEAYASLGDTQQIIRTIDWMIREGALRGGLDVMPGSGSWCIALRACLDTRDWGAAKTLTKRLASMTNSKRVIDSETIYLVLKITHALEPSSKQLHERQLRQALDAVYYVVSAWPKNSNEIQAAYAKLNPARAERRFVFQNALGDLVEKILNEFDGLRSIPGFGDLTYRLKQLRTEVPDETVARYQNYL